MNMYYNILFISLIAIVLANVHLTGASPYLQYQKRQTIISRSNLQEEQHHHHHHLLSSLTTTLDNNMSSSKSQRPATFKEYLAERELLVNAESNLNFENDVTITKKELIANDIIMAAKQIELAKGHANPVDFNPSQHFFDVLDSINNSTLFKILKIMPKGGILHAHDTALCSTDYLVSLTYWDHLWQCNNTETNEIVAFIFSKNKPESTETNLLWSLVSNERLRLGKTQYDQHVRSLFTLKTDNARFVFRDINDVWTKFMSIFILVEPIITYAPVFKDYYRQALQEAFEDNVQYIEFRGLLPQVYDLNGTNFTKSDIVRIYVETLNEFKEKNPEFIGSKFIFAPLRLVTDSTVSEYIKTVEELSQQYPSFIAGFDLVGQEDQGRSLLDLAEILLTMPENIKFFFHAGETNWFGSTDENLIDAILLGTKRIGHGYALSKHPTLLNLIKEKDIAVEVNPLSNQVLKLVEDFRNHPCATFFAQNVPLIISSDDPSFWEAAPLSHDFYQAFLGISSSRSNLKTLKKLAKNSIKYSSLNDMEKKDAFDKWQLRWDKFIDNIIQNNF